ncbi:hypothetical protein MP638_006373 [Amoeboaphelidium occidentale]|nr:hypothetical protein MP638_006373 [Amoeboaphelidium occidentale]
MIPLHLQKLLYYLDYELIYILAKEYNDLDIIKQIEEIRKGLTRDSKRYRVSVLKDYTPLNDGEYVNEWEQLLCYILLLQDNKNNNQKELDQCVDLIIKMLRNAKSDDIHYKCTLFHWSLFVLRELSAAAADSSDSSAADSSDSKRDLLMQEWLKNTHILLEESNLLKYFVFYTQQYIEGFFSSSDSDSDSDSDDPFGELMVACQEYNIQLIQNKLLKECIEYAKKDYFMSTQWQQFQFDYGSEVYKEFSSSITTRKLAEPLHFGTGRDSSFSIGETTTPLFDTPPNASIHVEGSVIISVARILLCIMFRNCSIVMP